MPFITIKIAPAGTPEADGSKSIAGHMWFTIDNGSGYESTYGFAPNSANQGHMSGQGQVKTDDDDRYIYDPNNHSFYTKRIEITQEQYDAIKSFADATKLNESNFNTFYEVGSNNCIKFTYDAMNEGAKVAGINLQDVDQFFAVAIPPNWQQGAVDLLAAKMSVTANTATIPNPDGTIASSITTIKNSNNDVIGTDACTFGYDASRRLISSTETKTVIGGVTSTDTWNGGYDESGNMNSSSIIRTDVSGATSKDEWTATYDSFLNITSSNETITNASGEVTFRHNTIDTYDANNHLEYSKDVQTDASGTATRETIAKHDEEGQLDGTTTNKITYTDAYGNVTYSKVAQTNANGANTSTSEIIAGRDEEGQLDGTKTAINANYNEFNEVTSSNAIKTDAYGNSISTTDTKNNYDNYGNFRNIGTLPVFILDDRC
jgi:hypothetical protein